MASIAYILLCHKDPEAILRKVACLTDAGDQVAIHFDKSAPPADYKRLREALAANPNVTFTSKRIRCGWGEWSLVKATLAGLRAARAAFADATHFYLISGDCLPIKPAWACRAFLDAQNKDFIECHDFFSSDWIKTGWKEERLIYRHLFNERTQTSWFYRSYTLQKWLGLRRSCPKDMQIMIGSQWWCLRRATVDKVLTYMDRHPGILRFFATTWIPDETFFQTLVAHVIPASQIESRSLTFLQFTDYGMPLTFCNDHHDMLTRQAALFTRKVSPDATGLHRKLLSHYTSNEPAPSSNGTGQRVIQYLTAQGRAGRRFAPRFWNEKQILRPGQSLKLILCKKWHVGKQILDELRDLSATPCLEYVFDEQACPLPDLGGYDATVERRFRHMRALLPALFETYETDTLVLCLDPSNIDVLRSLAQDQVDVLDVACTFSKEDLIGHAERVGLATPETPELVLRDILSALRAELAQEADRTAAFRFPQYQLHEDDNRTDRSAVLRRFLGDDTRVTPLTSAPVRRAQAG